MSNSTLNGFLQGVPPSEWTRRARAKEELRTAAWELRAEGLDYEDIAAALGVAKSSVSLWVRDLPTPPRLSYEENRKRSAEGSRRYWEVERTVREARRAAQTGRATAEIGAMTDREILIAGAVAFINSDPALIGFFLRFLDTAGLPRDDLIFRVYIRETAEAHRFWLDLTGAQASQFRRPVLKHHNPKTVRKNVGEGYRGCLRIDVRRSGDLYRRIEGWATGAMLSSA